MRIEEMIAAVQARLGIEVDGRAGHSNHHFGIAFDIGVFECNRHLGASPKYKAVGTLGMGLTKRQALAELRARHASGQPDFA